MKYLKSKQILINLKQNHNNLMMSQVSYVDKGNVLDILEGDLLNLEDVAKFQNFFAKYKDGLISILIESDDILEQEHQLFSSNKLESLIIKLIDFESNDTTDLSNNSKEKELLQNWLNYLANVTNPVKEIDVIHKGKKYKIRNKEIYSLIITDMLNYYVNVMLYSGALLLVLIFLFLFYNTYQVKQEINQLKVIHGGY